MGHGCGHNILGSASLLAANTEEIWSLVDAKERPFTELSDRVWGMPELCYGEFRSCAEHTATLERGNRVGSQRRIG
jgi:metal-dependent amidase/aminoacylase/carboxypeptidase family protein